MASEAARQEALVHFEKGMALVEAEAWSPALAELLLSRKLFPTGVATNNAAIVLQRLQRYDEALDMTEAYLRDFTVSPERQAAAMSRLAELRTLVGTIEIAGAETGASVTVSGQDRGLYPPVRPLRVAAGAHMLRVFKEGFDPYETRVDVAGGQTINVTAKLRRLSRSGKLRVIESSGKTVSVLIDKSVVGQTPWTGTLGVGEHVVTLRGEGKLGSQPSSTVVKPEGLTSLSLLAEELGATLQVEPTPTGASVWIDSVNVGNGQWLGRLKQGAHQVELKSDGFLTATRSIKLDKGARELVKVSLERDEDAERWRKPSKITLDATTSFLLVPTFGGALADACGDSCKRALGLGALGLIHGGYELGSGLGIGFQAGALIAAQDLDTRTASILPVGASAPSAGQADEALRLSGFLAGPTVGYHTGERFPTLVRLGAGALLGEVRNQRKGTFALSAARGGGEFNADPAVDFGRTAYVFLDPEVRVGIRLGERTELSAGIKVLLLIALSRPTWESSEPIDAKADGVATYPTESTMGDFVLMVAPGASLRHTF